MRRALTMRIDLDIFDKDRYEQIQRECERFKDKLMSEMDDYEFKLGEELRINIHSVSDGGDKRYERM